MVQLHTKKLKQRIQVKENKTEGVLNYDVDNAYPQRMLAAIAESGIATTCVDWYRRFIQGQGFTDEIFGKAIINPSGLTPGTLLRQVVKDFARMNGFAIHVNYNLNFQISDVSWMPWKRTRLTKPDSNDVVGKIAVHKDWGREHSSRIFKTDIDFIDTFNPDPQIVAIQMEAAGGIDKYKGQILWYSPELNSYPLAVYDPVLEDIETDAGIMTFKNRSVMTGFKASYLFIHKGKFETTRDREKFLDSLGDFETVINTNSMMLVEVEDKEEIPEIIKVDAPKNDKLFELTEKSIEENIRQIFHIPEVFIKSTPGKLGQDSSLQQAEQFYNKDTEDERLIFEEEFERLFKHFRSPINPSLDYSIIPFTFGS